MPASHLEFLEAGGLLKQSVLGNPRNERQRAPVALVISLGVLKKASVADWASCGGKHGVGDGKNIEWSR